MTIVVELFEFSRTAGSVFLNVSKSENFQFWVSEAKIKK